MASSPLPCSAVLYGANHHAVLDALEEQLRADNIHCVRIDGRTKVEDRQKAVETFQTNPNCKVFLGSTKAAGVGLTLTAASDVLVVEQEWVPADLDQAEDRTHRIGQLNAVNCIHLIAENSVDQKLLDVIEAKRLISHQAITGEGEQLTAIRSSSVLSDVLASYQAQADARNGHTKTKKPKREHKVRSDEKTLLEAAREGNLEGLRIEIEKGPGIEACSKALVISAEAEQLDCVKELLSHSSFDGAKPTSMKPEHKVFIENYFEEKALRDNLPPLLTPETVETGVLKLGRVA